MERTVDVDMGCRIDKGSCTPLNEGIVALAVKDLADLLHIRLPVDLGVLKFMISVYVTVERGI